MGDNHAARIPIDADEPLPLTGERTAPGIDEENYWFQRHVLAYRFAAERVAGMRVLDAGCGEGYGPAILAEAAREVDAVDLDAEVIRRAGERYPGIAFREANLVELPYEDDTFDAIVCLQVIEHLHTPGEFLAECARTLRPGGTLILSTPNRLTFSPGGTRNPFHTFEFAPDELRAVLERHLTEVEVAGTFHGAGLRALEATMRGSLPERLVSQPAYEWPDWLRSRVRQVKPDDFRIKAKRLERSLDLIAVARR